MTRQINKKSAKQYYIQTFVQYNTKPCIYSSIHPLYNSINDAISMLHPCITKSRLYDHYYRNICTYHHAHQYHRLIQINLGHFQAPLKEYDP